MRLPLAIAATLALAGCGTDATCLRTPSEMGTVLSVDERQVTHPGGRLGAYTETITALRVQRDADGTVCIATVRRSSIAMLRPGDKIRGPI